MYPKIRAALWSYWQNSEAVCAAWPNHDKAPVEPNIPTLLGLDGGILCAGNGCNPGIAT